MTLADPFTITIADPCDAPVSVVASTLTNQEYTITDNVAPYTVPIYTADPAWCAIWYTYTITDVSDDAGLTFNDDPLTREFSFNYSSVLFNTRASSKEYIVTVTGTSGNMIETSDSADFTLTLRNPCIDPAYVTIEQAVLLNQVYEIYEFDSGFQFTHNPFTVKTLPYDHTLCGDLV